MSHRESIAILRAFYSHPSIRFLVSTHSPTEKKMLPYFEIYAADTYLKAFYLWQLTWPYVPILRRFPYGIQYGNWERTPYIHIHSKVLTSLILDMATGKYYHIVNCKAITSNTRSCHIVCFEEFQLLTFNTAREKRKLFCCKLLTF